MFWKPFVLILMVRCTDLPVVFSVPEDDLGLVHRRLLNASDYMMFFTQHTRQVLNVVGVVCQETVKDISQCRYALYIQV